ncbi:squalene/phytoene synthase family protein [Salinibacterium sp. SYSU T00001]|uniref:phytoene/squalene synthase family protein n=1 Tax=Homoserinimonas sedimenticola TaxID=2986805 RepID=UPI002235E0CE|nr:squalene/phytoene synthase family protein [Salinibacterium sedimenticola]MCW4385620.1 squalene/phytoene synthase family protein [Salinibacterium sedimenticola]
MSATTLHRLDLYTRVCERASALVIREYSTSFGAASRLLEPRVRRHVANIYALVRVADEVVDGASDEAGMSRAEAARALDELEAQTDLALERGYCTNPIVHAFARSAREVGFGRELTEPFFASMRADLEQAEHDPESFTRYVYGSAEVIGLMCLQAFLLGHSRSEPQLLELRAGARALGAAFQKVNFLRDLADDYEALGRSYFPQVHVASFSEADKARILDDIDSDLRVSRAALPLLPPGSRRAVCLAHSLFAELARRLRGTPARDILAARLSVPTPVKARLALEAAAGRMPRA